MSKRKRDVWAMKVAIVTSSMSTCCRRNVGCVLLNKRGHLLVTGYNGVAAGLPHCNEAIQQEVVTQEMGYKVGEVHPVPISHPNKCPAADAPSGQDLDGCQAIHAEQNALLQCRNVYEIETCYTTASPCMTCVKLLLNTSCRRIVYSEEYPHEEARRLWTSSGRVWQQIDEVV